MNINYDKFKEICLAPWEYFTALKGAQEVDDGKGHKYIYFDRGSRILAVAHLDTVQKKDFHFHAIEIAGNVWVFNAQLDDRIGAYAILDLLPRLGLEYDILLTTDEEIGKSTAHYFTTQKDYLWMFEVDRRGEDVVHYQYDREFLKKRLKKAGFLKVEIGAKSDIWYLDFLGCCGFNVGTGYEDEHTVWAKANMSVFTRQMERLVKFYEKYRTLYFKYDPKDDKPVVNTYAYWERPVPEGYSRTWATGAIWDNTIGAYKLPVPVAQQNLNPNCNVCEVVLTFANRSNRYSTVCRNCAADLFECVGCGELRSLHEETALCLCKTCHTEIENVGSDKFVTKQKCEVDECANYLTWKEYSDGVWCTTCTDKWNLDVNGMPFM